MMMLFVESQNKHTVGMWNLSMNSNGEVFYKESGAPWTTGYRWPSFCLPLRYGGGCL